MKERRQFEEDTPNICTIGCQQYKSQMGLMKHMLSHNSSKSDAPTKPAKTEDCNVCVEFKNQRQTNA